MELSPALLSLVLSALTPFVLEWLKDKPWAPFVQRYRADLNRVTAAIVAAGNAVGVAFAYDAATGTLTITGLDLTQILTIGVTALLAFITQEIVYRKAVQ